MNANLLNEDNIGELNPIDILLVEDNEADVEITLRAFEMAKPANRLHVVNNGEEALDYIFRQGAYKETKIQNPDVVLLDIIMPKLDGFETLKRIKQNEQVNHIPIIMLTSSKNEEDILKSYSYGAASYIPKPVNYDDFVTAVQGFNFYWQGVSRFPKKLRVER